MIFFRKSFGPDLELMGRDMARRGVPEDLDDMLYDICKPFDTALCW